MKKKERNTANNGNNIFYTLLAIGLIINLWILWFAGTRLINHFFNWDYYLLRVIIIFPLTMTNLKLCKLIWNHYG